MEDYSFWADLLHSYRESPDIIKALWVLVPPGFVLGLVAVMRLTRRAPRRGEGEIVYTMMRDGDGAARIRADARTPSIDYDPGPADVSRR